MKNKMMKWLFTFIAISICVVAKGNVSEAAITYTVTYEVYGDQFTDSFEGSAGATSCYETAFSTKEYIVTKGIPVVKEDDGKVTSRFMGWSYTRLGDVEVRPGENLGILSSNITLYPIYASETTTYPNVMFTVYNPSGETEEGNGSFVYVAENCYFDFGSYNPSDVGYEFIGWSIKNDDDTAELGAEGPYLNDFATETEDAILHAAWAPAIHDIVFDTNGGTFSDGSTSATRQTRSYDALDISDLVPTRENYVFLGWGATSSSASVDYTTTYKENILIYSTQNLYAVWVPKEYTITYDANGGTGAPANQTQSYDQTVTIPSTVPVREGYDFYGWACKFTELSTTSYYNAGQSFKRESYMGTSATIEFTAEWRSKKYIVTYDANGGEGVPAPQTKVHGVTLTLDSTVTPQRDYGTFLGWATTKDAKTANMGDTYSLNKDITLYAVWNMEEHSVTFDENGGYYGPGVLTKVHGTALTIPTSVPEKDGYTFLGWATSATATTAAYKAGSSYEVEGDSTLYAVWQKSSGAGSTGINDGSGTGTTDDGTTIAPDGPVSQTITVKVTDIAYKKNKKVSLGAATDGGGALTYKSSNKKVATINKKGKLTVKGFGKTIITVTAAAKGEYIKTVKKFTIQVVPNKVTLSKASAIGGRKVTTKWKKVKNISGYEMYLSLDKNFENNTYERDYKKSDTSAKIIGLAKGKTYYFKIRAYKTVKGKEYYGAWSKVKRVKVK